MTTRAMARPRSHHRRQSSSLAPASNPLYLSRRGPAAPSGVHTWLRNTISDFGRVRENERGGEKNKEIKIPDFFPSSDQTQPSTTVASFPPSLPRARVMKQKKTETPPEHPRRLLHGPIGRRAGRAPLGRVRAARGRLPEQLREGAVQRDDGGGVRLCPRLELDARDGRPRGLGRVREEKRRGEEAAIGIFGFCSPRFTHSRTLARRKRGFFFPSFSLSGSIPFGPSTPFSLALPLPPLPPLSL